jgi:hypothetical protein
MQSDILNLLTTISAANGDASHTIERYLADRNIEMSALGRRARQSLVNKIRFAANAMAAAIKRATDVLAEVKQSNDDFHFDPRC